MSDGFDAEFAALRGEVGAFVLDVLTRERPEVLDQIAAGLGERLRARLSVTANLEAPDARLLRDVERALAEFNRKLPALADPGRWPTEAARQDAGAGVYDPRPAEGPRPVAVDVRPEPFARDRDRGRSLLGFAGRDGQGQDVWVWFAIGVSVVVLAIAGMVAFNRWSGAPVNSSPPTTRMAGADNVSGETGGDNGSPASGGTVESGWKSVLQTAETFGVDGRSRLLKDLCGPQSPANCTFAARRAAWAKDPKAAARAVTALREVLGPGHPCLTEPDADTPTAAPPADARAALPFAACLLEKLP
jgi:hypothetical protein